MPSISCFLILLLFSFYSCIQGFDSFGLNLPVQISSSPSAFVLIQPYSCHKKEDFCIGSPTYHGITNQYGTWSKSPSPIITSFQPASGVLEGTLGFASSQGSLIYNVTLGNTQALIESGEWQPTATKTIAQLRFEFQCGWADENYAKLEPKTFYIPSSMARASWELDKDCPLYSLKQGEFYYVADVDGKEYYNSIPQEGRLMKIGIYFRAVYPTLEELWNAWVKTAFQYEAKDPGFKDTVSSLILVNMTYSLNLAYDPENLISGDMETWMLNCSNPRNQKACDYKVIDDWDYNYNSLMWALGRTGGQYLRLTTLEAVESTLEEWGNFKKLPACYKGEKLDNEAVVAIYCEVIFKGRCQGVNHVAYFHHELLAWTSKFGKGPLIIHENLEELSNYGDIVSCMRRMRKSEDLSIDKITDI